MTETHFVTLSGRSCCHCVVRNCEGFVTHLMAWKLAQRGRFGSYHRHGERCGYCPFRVLRPALSGPFHGSYLIISSMTSCGVPSHEKWYPSSRCRMIPCCCRLSPRGLPQISCLVRIHCTPDYSKGSSSIEPENSQWAASLSAVEYS